MEKHWEAVDQTLYRRKLPGGWLVQAMLLIEEDTQDETGEWHTKQHLEGMCMTFIPDPGHEWVIGE